MSRNQGERRVTRTSASVHGARSDGLRISRRPRKRVAPVGRAIPELESCPSGGSREHHPDARRELLVERRGVRASACVLGYVAADQHGKIEAHPLDERRPLEQLDGKAPHDPRSGLRRAELDVMHPQKIDVSGLVTKIENPLPALEHRGGVRRDAGDPSDALGFRRSCVGCCRDDAGDEESGRRESEGQSTHDRAISHADASPPSALHTLVRSAGKAAEASNTRPSGVLMVTLAA